jgi:16S rRNA (guanine527-N7)-methyltransferase
VKGTSAPTRDGLGPAIAALASQFPNAAPRPEQLDDLVGFVRLLLTWNARINLTGARTPEEVVADHFPDAFALAGVVPAAARLVDVGSGGGLPAVPFLILRPDVHLTMVEPRAKRVAFLRTATRTLHLRAEVEGVRVEEIVRRDFQVAVSRATFPPAEWLLKAAPLLSPGGAIGIFAAAQELPPLPSTSRLVRYQAAGKPRTLAFVPVDSLAGVPRGT